MSFKTFKRVSPFLLSATMLLGVMAGCAVTNDSTNSGGTNDTNTNAGNKDLEQFVKSVTVKTQPIKTQYIVGETIDLKGLTFDTVWSIYGEDTDVPDMTYQDLDSYDKTAAEGMTSVKCTIGGFTFEVAITVLDVSTTYSSLEFKRIDGSDSNSIIKGTAFFDTYKITAKGKDGTPDRVLVETDDISFKVKHGETNEDTNLANVFSIVGDITVTVNWHGLEGSFDAKVFNGYMVYGKDMIATEDITPEDKNFLEKDKDSSAMKVSSDAGVQYAGEIRQGYHLIFHVWSDVVRNANVILYASSIVRINWPGYPDKANTWKPTETGELQFNKTFTVTYGADKTPINVGDDVILPGNESTITDPNKASYKTPDDKGRYYDPKIWVNWKAVNFGTIPLQVGDNIITLTNINNGGNVANVYGLEAQFVD